MTMRFLPWVRRGLVAAVEQADTLGSLPANPSFGVTVRLVSDAGGRTEATADIGLLGPGNVTGVDTRSIIRTEPRRHATNVEPDSFVALEFDDPDFPWMFTPARAGDENKLRPWLVLVVVEDGEGVDIVPGGGPLPRLVIDEPTVPADELPDLGESWAWAHAQVITGAASDPIRDNLEGDADRNLSRLICPRRLKADRSYIAALVPAFKQGIAAGLGSAEIPAGDFEPAWVHASLRPTVSLPLYYHWSFRTGPAGNFESLASQLQPMPLPEGVGSAPMDIGSADPSIRPLAGDAAICTMEGALRSVVAPRPPAVDAGFTTDLVAAVDAANQDGTDAVGPPIYGGRHVQRTAIPAPNRVPRWLRDLNAEVRQRAAAGLGVQVVRANQETYIDEAWDQVGDVLRANQLLRMAALARLAMRRLHDKHIVGVEPGRLLSMTASSHQLLRFGTTSMAMAHRASATPNGLTSPAMRRALSPHNQHLKLAARRFELATDAAGGLELSRAATHGALPRHLATTPPGLADTSAVAAVASRYADLVEPDVAAAVTAIVNTAIAAEGLVTGGPVDRFELRGDLASVGVPTPAHLALARQLAEVDQPLSAVLSQLAPRAGAGAGAQPIVAYGVGDAGAISPILVERDGTFTAVREGTRIEVDRPMTDRIREGLGGVVGPRIGGVGSRRRLAPGGVAGASRAVPAGRGGPGGRVGTGPAPPAREAGGDAAIGMVIEPLLTSADVLGDYITTFNTQMVSVGVLVPTVIQPTPLDVAAAAETIVEQSDPVPVIAARVAARVRVDGVGLRGLDGFARPTDGARLVDVWQPSEVSPIMVGPRIGRPLYRDLAAYDQQRFLPGVGQIPDDAVTLVATNPAFVEAFLVGANHEFNRELLWRRYPTDARGTAFRSFWDSVDGSPDIEAIHTWPGQPRLGELSAQSAEGSVVLLVRGNLLKRYPNTVVYASPATPDRKIDGTAEIRLPTFTGRLDPDIRFAGFDLTPSQVRSGDGWMFVLQEQPAEPRFGLDVPGSAAPPRWWSELHWGHAQVEPGGHLCVGDLASLSLPLDKRPGAPVVRLARNSATLAAATFQLPFRAAIHSSEILDVM